MMMFEQDNSEIYKPTNETPTQDGMDDDGLDGPTK